MTKFVIHGTPISVYVRTARMLLELAETAYDLKNVNIFNGENKTPEYLAKNPFGKVPTLEIDGVMLYESPAITDYLDATAAGGKFTPQDPLLRARMRQIMAIVDNYLYGPSIGTVVIQRLIVPSKGGQPDEAAIQGAVAPIQKSLGAIEAIAASPHLLGSELTIADLYLIPFFVYLAQTPEFDTLTAETPKLQDWWAQAKDLPVIQKVTK